MIHGRSATAVVVLGLLAGCGGSGEEDKRPAADQPKQRVVDATKRYQTAFLDSDRGVVCDLLTGDAKRELVTTTAPLGATDCEAAAGKVFDLAGKDELAKIKSSSDRLTERDVKLQGERATVTLPTSGKRLELKRAAGEWLISDPNAR